MSCKHKLTYIQCFARSKKVYVYCMACRKCLERFDIRNAPEKLNQEIVYGEIGWCFGEGTNSKNVLENNVRKGAI